VVSVVNGKCSKWKVVSGKFGIIGKWLSVVSGK
jgi:hypothetical protein